MNFPDITPHPAVRHGLCFFTSGRGAGMMADLTTSRLNSAVQLCLQRCYRAENPIAALAIYLQDLRRVGWCEAEIEDLEIVVRRILRRVLRPANPDRMTRSRSA
jgi:hypothetical protein